MTTVRGRISPNTVTSGIPTTFLRAGLPTATVTGTTSALGAGLGLATNLGVLLPITMADGTILAAGGAGARAHFLDLRSTDRLLSVSSAGALASASAGSRWALANPSSHGS